MFGKFKLSEVIIHINCTSRRYDGKCIQRFPFIKVGYHISNGNYYSLCVIYDEYDNSLKTVVVKYGKIIAKGDF